MSDKDILALIHQGNLRAGFDAIVKAYSERLYWHIRRYVCSHEDADDLVQEVYIKVWKALPDFRGESEVFTWLYRIATNEALNFLHKKKVRAALAFESITTELERRIDSDPFFNGDQAMRILGKALAGLPEKQRSVFIMRFYDDLSYEQISEITGTSVGALKASFHFAREKIQHILEENDAQILNL